MILVQVEPRDGAWVASAAETNTPGRAVSDPHPSAAAAIAQVLAILERQDVSVGMPAHVDAEALREQLYDAEDALADAQETIKALEDEIVDLHNEIEDLKEAIDDLRPEDQCGGWS